MHGRWYVIDIVHAIVVSFHESEDEARRVIEEEPDWASWRLRARLAMSARSSTVTERERVLESQAA